MDGIVRSATSTVKAEIYSKSSFESFELEYGSAITIP